MQLKTLLLKAPLAALLLFAALSAAVTLMTAGTPGKTTPQHVLQPVALHSSPEVGHIPATGTAQPQPPARRWSQPPPKLPQPPAADRPPTADVPAGLARVTAIKQNHDNHSSATAPEPGFVASIDILFDAQQTESTREAAIETLGNSKQPFYDHHLSLLALAHVLQSDSPTLRSAAIDTLALIRHPHTASLLLQALGDPLPQLREDALYALLDLDPADRNSLLIQALGNSQPAIRELAAEALHNPLQ